VIRVRGLRKEYPGGAAALDGIDLDIGRGEFVALIGPSGAGKSTLLRCLNGLVIPSAGQVEMDGVPVTGATPEALRRIRVRIGFVFQQFNLLRRLTVLENTVLGRLALTGPWRSMMGWFEPAAVARAEATLARVGLAGIPCASGESPSFTMIADDRAFKREVDLEAPQPGHCRGRRRGL